MSKRDGNVVALRLDVGVHGLDRRNLRQNGGNLPRDLLRLAAPPVAVVVVPVVVVAVVVVSVVVSVVSVPPVHLVPVHAAKERRLVGRNAKDMRIDAGLLDGQEKDPGILEEEQLQVGNERVVEPDE